MFIMLKYNNDFILNKCSELIDRTNSRHYGYSKASHSAFI